MNEMENNVNVAEVAVKKPLGKKIALICAIAAVIVAGAAAIGIFAASSSPLTLVGQGAVNSLAALEKNELVQLMTAVSEGGSAELTCDLKTLTESAIGFGVDGRSERAHV